ncbi:MAG: urea transporter [Paludibacter sp.]
MYQRLNTFRNLILPGILNSYSVIFFFNNQVMGAIILLVSFFNFFAGLSGLIAVLFSILIANGMGLDKTQLKQGLFSFNALFLGMGMGTFFDPSLVFFSLLLLSALITLILSVTLGGWLNKYGLPVLSIPFVITFWFVVLPSSQFENLGLTQRNIYWMNDLYALGGNTLLNFFQTLDNLPVHKMVDIYLRSLSSIFFQNNIITGVVIAIMLLINSRITFSLSIIGFLSAYLFAQFTGSAAASITYYNIGANYIMVAIAMGGFFAIPSRYSYLWAIMLVPLTSLVLLFMNKLLGFIQLPVFSLPFSFVTIFFLYFLILRKSPTKFLLTPVQFYSPEVNLYTFNNNKDRLSNLLYFPLYLPFWGEWTVTQGHDGAYTHKGDWGKAFDFMLVDDMGKTYSESGNFCENYYCYNKPILAPADGIVEEIYDNIDDNEIGKVNTTENWGNTIIIKHLNGLYTQMSHLKKGSFKVLKGDFVHGGDIVALCGNSGRSPEPHLHYQVQITPFLGSKTIDYPFGYYLEKKNNKGDITQFSKPAEGAIIAGIESNKLAKKAFDIMPNSTFEFSYMNEKGVEIIEKWESYTDAYNNKYLYCKETESSAFYVNDGSMFYFTSFFGNKKSLLYYFYLSAYKVLLGNLDDVELRDAMPLNIIRNKKLGVFLHDFVAPFYNYMRVWYSIKLTHSDNTFDTSLLVLNSSIDLSVFGKLRNDSEGSITLSQNKITEFTYKTTKLNIRAKCIN